MHYYLGGPRGYRDVRWALRFEVGVGGLPPSSGVKVVRAADRNSPEIWGGGDPTHPRPSFTKDQNCEQYYYSSVHWRWPKKMWRVSLNQRWFCYTLRISGVSTRMWFGNWASWSGVIILKPGAPCPWGGGSQASQQGLPAGLRHPPPWGAGGSKK